MSTTKITIPSIHSVSRAAQYSDGYLFGLDDEGNASPILVHESSIRGSKSSYSDGHKAAKRVEGQSEKDINTPNLQRVDVANLAADQKRLRLQFSMNIMSIAIDNQVCNSAEYLGKIEKFIGLYKKNGGFSELGRLVAWRLANASALWRNRYGIDKTVVVTDIVSNKEYTFNAEDYSAVSPDGMKADHPLAVSIAAALSGDRPVLMLKVVTEVTLGYGQEVFPSQNFIDEDEKKRLKTSKQLYRTMWNGQAIAGMHSQKVGAAIRAFDIWHPDVASSGPLPIEPYGYSHGHQNSMRAPSTRKDLYTMLMGLDDEIDAMSTAASHVTDDQHFIMGCLLRGGVFSGESDSAAKARAKKGAESAAETEGVANES